jgi:hypothetical protein
MRRFISPHTAKEILNMPSATCKQNVGNGQTQENSMWTKHHNWGENHVLRISCWWGVPNIITPRAAQFPDQTQSLSDLCYCPRYSEKTNPNFLSHLDSSRSEMNYTGYHLKVAPRNRMSQPQPRLHRGDTREIHVLCIGRVTDQFQLQQWSLDLKLNHQFYPILGSANGNASNCNMMVTSSYLSMFQVPSKILGPSLHW